MMLAILSRRQRSNGKERAKDYLLCFGKNDYRAMFSSSQKCYAVLNIKNILKSPCHSNSKSYLIGMFSKN